MEEICSLNKCAFSNTVTSDIRTMHLNFMLLLRLICSLLGLVGEYEYFYAHSEKWLNGFTWDSAIYYLNVHSVCVYKLSIGIADATFFPHHHFSLLICCSCDCCMEQKHILRSCQIKMDPLMNICLSFKLFKIMCLCLLWSYTLLRECLFWLILVIFMPTEHFLYQCTLIFHFFS